MDLGATVCTPRSPSCGICPLIDMCAGRSDGVAATLPRKEKKKPKPVRHGHIYVATTQDGGWVLERRAEKGLLGGMLGWPGSEWNDAPDPTPPFAANWAEIGEVRHTFTHFHLILRVYSAGDVSNPPETSHVVKAQDFRPSDLPTVMRKAFDLAHFPKDTHDV